MYGKWACKPCVQYSSYRYKYGNKNCWPLAQNEGENLDNDDGDSDQGNSNQGNGNWRASNLTQFSVLVIL